MTCSVNSLLNRAFIGDRCLFAANMKFFKAARARFYKTVYGIYIKSVFLRVSPQLAEDDGLESHSVQQIRTDF